MGIPTENEKGAIYSKLQTVDDVGPIKGCLTKLGQNRAKKSDCRSSTG